MDENLSFLSDDMAPKAFETVEEMKMVDSLLGAASALEKAASNTSDPETLVEIAYAWIGVGRAWGKRSKDRAREQAEAYMATE